MIYQCRPPDGGGNERSPAAGNRGASKATIDRQGYCHLYRQCTTSDGICQSKVTILSYDCNHFDIEFPQFQAIDDQKLHILVDQALAGIERSSVALARYEQAAKLERERLAIHRVILSELETFIPVEVAI
jgi:hypothetical protein